MKNNVYIAGSWKNRNDVKHLMDEIEEWGCKIMVDWTNHKKKDNIIDYVQEYIKGLQECDCFVYCMDGIKSIGKTFELGYVTALNKPVGIFLFENKIFGPNMEKISFDKILEKECIYIRANIYQIIRTIDELKNWLLDIVPSKSDINKSEIISDVNKSEIISDVNKSEIISDINKSEIISDTSKSEIISDKSEIISTIGSETTGIGT